MSNPPSNHLANWRPHQPFRRYAWGAALVVLATWFSSLIHRFLSPTNLVVVYLLAVVITAIFWGRGPAIMVSFLSVLSFDYFFVPPYLTLAVSQSEYIVTFFGLLLVGIIISYLTAQVREQAEAAQRRERQTAALYELGRALTTTTSLDAIVQTIMAHISQSVERSVAVLLLREKHLVLSATSEDLSLDPHELQAAQWAFEHNQPTGAGYEVFSDLAVSCRPLYTPRGVIGVLAVQSTGERPPLTNEQNRLLDAFANQAALAIEQVRLAEQARQAELLEIAEKLQAALVNAISHDLRTPLVSITGALTSLSGDGPAFDDEVRRSLIETARDEANRLNRLVGNLLDMARLESGALHVHTEPCDVQELIGSSLEQVSSHLEDRQVAVDMPANMPLVPLDFVLIDRVLVNLLENAIKYSPPGSPLSIRAAIEEKWCVINVCDQGLGIPSEDLERVFDKFYRVQRPGNVNGTGLGLSISKGLIEAHGGLIKASQAATGGTCITIQLPLEGNP